MLLLKGKSTFKFSFFFFCSLREPFFFFSFCMFALVPVLFVSSLFSLFPLPLPSLLLHLWTLSIQLDALTQASCVYVSVHQEK